MAKCALVSGKCPRTNDREADRFCPMWQEQVWENPSTGDKKLRKECGVGLLFESINNVGGMANYAMQEASKSRNILELARLSASEKGALARLEATRGMD